MEKRVALKVLSRIKQDLEDESSTAQSIINCQMDAKDIANELFGAESSHYKTIRDATKFSIGIQREILLGEIDSMIRELENGIVTEPVSKALQITNPADSLMSKGKDKVFIVHGRDDSVKEITAQFLKELDLEPIILHEQPNKGRTIIEKFEDHSSDAKYAVVLLTPDDVGGLKSDPTKLSLRARQNVVFEMGHFFGKLGRKKVCALLYPGVERPSDIDGIVYISFDQEEEWKRLLVRELDAAGLKVNPKNHNSEMGIGLIGGVIGLSDASGQIRPLGSTSMRKPLTSPNTRSSGGWDVRKSHAKRVSVHSDTKAEAVDRARDISSNQGAECIIHSKDGKIQNSNSHIKDVS